MKITLLTYGSRGDVQPFLALAVGLQAAGHAVTLAAPQRFTGFIQERGIHCVPLAGDPDELSLLFNDAGKNVLRMLHSMQQHVYRIAPDVVKGTRKALQGADLLVHSFIFTTGGHSFARELDIPDISLQLFPVFAPTRLFPAVGMPERLPRGLNSFSHWLSTQVFWHGGNLGYYQLRRKAPDDFPARLFWPFRPAAGRPITPLVIACSPVVLSKPPEWDAPHIHLPGYLFLDNPDYQPPDELTRFLASGEPPVCITFGSMVNREAERIGQAALEAVRRTGGRAIFLTGWGGWQSEAADNRTLFLDAAPHEWLFPRCRAVIHHGGAGTTAANLRAGVPSIIVPHAADQSFWGSRAAAIGAGPKPLSINGLSADTLAAAILDAHSAVIRRRAGEIGELIRAEDGTGAIVSLIEEHADRFHRQRG
jgi:sterol 3beta-glucosyltransferase